MSVQSFHSFIFTDEQLAAFGGGSCVRSANLLTLRPASAASGTSSSSGANQGARNKAPGSFGSSQRFALVLDAESCLDRLYGGYFIDWTLGGQWGQMLDFLSTLMSTLQRSNVQIATCINGALEPTRFSEWKEEQKRIKENVDQVFRHIHKRATPPPKAWWVPPLGLRTMLRLMLKSLNSTVCSSVEDHRLEIMDFCWENEYHGVASEDGEIALFSPPAYFSAKSLKISFEHEVTIKESNLDQVAQCLDLNPNRFCLLGALLGNHILTTADLAEFHARLAPEAAKAKKAAAAANGAAKPADFAKIIRATVNYIRTLPTIDEVDQIGKDAFGSENDPRIRRLKNSIKYFKAGLKESSRSKGRRLQKGKKYVPIKIGDGDDTDLEIDEVAATPATAAKARPKVDKQKSESEIVERIALDFDQLDLNKALADAQASAEAEATADDRARTEEEEISVVQALASGLKVTPSADGKYPAEKKKELDSAATNISIPAAHTDILLTALERHKMGQMHPMVHQLLTKGEVKLPVLLEDLSANDLPPIHNLYQPLRQSIYAVVYNAYHLKFTRRQYEETMKAKKKKAEEFRKEANKTEDEDKKKELMAKADAVVKESKAVPHPPPGVRVREWSPYNDYKEPFMLKPLDLNWSCPTVQRLWFGTSQADKQKRLRAFFAVMKCDDCPPMLSQANIPQHLLLLACVLRYLMTGVAMRKPELDAMLVTAFSPELRNPRMIAEMRPANISSRGVRLATMINNGIELALLANDICGAPIPVQMCLPWTFFDGRVFHRNLQKADACRNLIELCDGRMNMVYAIEAMRSAILHGLVHEFAVPGHMPFHFPGGAQGSGNPAAMAAAAAAAAAAAHAAGRGPMGPGGMKMARGGGQLVVGGQVVGQWGPNHGPKGNKNNNNKKKGQKKNKNKGNTGNANGNSSAKKDSAGSQEPAGSSSPEPAESDADFILEVN